MNQKNYLFDSILYYSVLYYNHRILYHIKIINYFNHILYMKISANFDQWWHWSCWIFKKLLIYFWIYCHLLVFLMNLTCCSSISYGLPANFHSSCYLIRSNAGFSSWIAIVFDLYQPIRIFIRYCRLHMFEETSKTRKSDDILR